MSVVQINQEPNGRWRWSFRESDTTKPIPSNEDYDDLDAALVAARAAYPDTPIADPVATTGRGRRGPKRGERNGEGGGPVAKIARWLTPIVVLIAWSRSKRR